MANISGALMKLGGGALQQGSKKAIEKVANKAIEEVATKAATKALTNTATRGLTGAGISTLAKGSGSTLDGILGRSSGIVLPSATVAPKTISQWTEEALGTPISTVGGVMQEMDVPLSELAKEGSFSKRNLDLITKNARDVADIKNYAIEGDNRLGVTAKSNLPALNREQYYDDTLGRVGRNGVRAADVPDYMQRHLSSNVDKTAGNDSILREFFGDNTSPISELYDKYERLAQSGNANEIFTPENVDSAIAMEGRRADEITQDFADRTFGNKRNIGISGGAGPAKNIKVGRAKASLGAEETATDVVNTTNPRLADDVASIREQITATGAGGSGRIGGGTVTDMPGSEGFNVKLKTGETVDVPLASSAEGSTRQQRAVRKLDDMTAKSMNANNKQYRNIVGKSGSIDGHYKSIAERIRAEKIDQANVADKAQAALNLREDIKQQGLQYAEANGVTMDLSNIDNTIGLSAVQKRKLAELGLGLDDMLGGNGVVTPTQAEEIYKVLRQYGYEWEDSKDALTNMAGKAMKKEAEAVRNIIDNTMDNINVDYKTSLVEEAARNGEDPAYLRQLAAKKDFKFSDLRKDQSDWITINDLSGNKIAEEPTLNVFGLDTGAKNPFYSGAEKIREKIYERQAYGRPRGTGGAGGSGGTGTGAPTGSAGPENTINFTTPAGGTGTLGGLLGKVKGAAPVAAGVLGGMMLGGGGNNGSAGYDYGDFEDYSGEETQAEDPYQTMTLGGYTYQQLEDGYVRALQAGDSNAAKLIANMLSMLGDKIENAQKTTTSSGTAAKQKAAMNVLSGLMKNYEAQGPIGGRFTQFMNAITGGGYNPAVSAYDTGAAGSLGTIIKALGDTGALSEGDQKRALELLPKTTDSETAAKAKYQQLMQILKSAGAQ